MIFRRFCLPKWWNISIKLQKLLLETGIVISDRHRSSAYVYWHFCMSFIIQASTWSFMSVSRPSTILREDRAVTRQVTWLSGLTLVNHASDWSTKFSVSDNSCLIVYSGSRELVMRESWWRTRSAAVVYLSKRLVIAHRHGYPTIRYREAGACLGR